MTNEELCTRIQNGETELLCDLWDSLYRFVHQQARRFYTVYNERCVSAGITLDDLIQHSYLILCRAAELYKDGEYRFTTYFGKSLLHGYLRLISYNRRTPLNNCVSLDKPIDSDNSDDTLIDVTADPSAEADIDDVIETEYQRELQRDVQSALSLLSDTERDVIHERFWNCRTLKELSEIHGITPQEARKTEHQALQQLRSPKALKYLNAYRQDIISIYGYSGSLEMWRNSHTSSTERTVLKLEERGL